MTKITIQDEWRQDDGKYACPTCGKCYTFRGIATHIYRAHGAGANKRLGGAKKGVIPWNKGLTKETDGRLASLSEHFATRYQNEAHPWFGRSHSDESKLRMSKARSQNNKGGRCKWFVHVKPSGETIKVQGTWECRFANVLDILDPDWIKPSRATPEHLLTWHDAWGNEHYYTPDFWSPKLQRYFEVKGRWWGNDKQKMECVVSQNDVEIQMVFGRDLDAYEALLLD